MCKNTTLSENSDIFPDRARVTPANAVKVLTALFILMVGNKDLKMGEEDLGARTRSDFWEFIK